MPAYSIYLVRCRDGSLYTGIATDVSRRLSEHENGIKGAKYLRGKGPLKLVYQQEIGDRSIASKLESRVKRLSRTEKSDVKILSERIKEYLSDLSPDSSAVGILQVAALHGPLCLDSVDTATTLFSPTADHHRRGLRPGCPPTGPGPSALTARCFASAITDDRLDRPSLGSEI